MEGVVTEHVTFTSSKITGDKDRGRLETALSGIDGVRNVTTDTGANTVTVVFDPAIVSVPKLRAAIEDAGYPVKDEAFASSRDMP